MKKYILKSLVVGVVLLPCLPLIGNAPTVAYVASIAYLCALCALCNKYKDKVKEFLKDIQE